MSELSTGELRDINELILDLRARLEQANEKYDSLLKEAMAMREALAHVGGYTADGSCALCDGEISYYAMCKHDSDIATKSFKSFDKWLEENKS